MPYSPLRIIGKFENQRLQLQRIQFDEGAYFILRMSTLSRRELLTALARAVLLTSAGALSAPSLLASVFQSQAAQDPIALSRPRYRVSSEDDGLLDELARCAVRFFW